MSVGDPSTMVIHVAPRGKDMAGLMRYLYGPGKANEHTEQHLVAASHDLEFAYAGRLSGGEASELGRVVEASWHEQVAEANALVGAGRGGVSRASLKTGDGAVSDAEKEHVYHLIVSLPPGAEWSDEQWATVARDVVEGMGFDAGGDDDKGCRWAAVRHGLSAKGNDHLHIAVNLVRQDGRRQQLPANDYRLANQVRATIEQRQSYVLPLHDAGRAPVRSLPGYTIAEHSIAKDRAKQSGPFLPDRVFLQQVVRAAATAARTEAEWLDAVTDAPDVEIEAARWAEGGRPEVTGYKVRRGDGPWLSASQLAPDLTLSTLRPRWAEHEDAETRAAAVAIWREEAPLPAGVTPAVVSTHLDTAEAALAEWVEDLKQAAPDDRPMWRHTVREAAGVVSSLSRDPGPEVEALAGVGQTLARQSLEVVGDPRAGSLPRPSFGPTGAQLAARHVQLALRAGGTASHPGWIAVLQQLRQVLAAIEAAQRARGELTAARQLATAQRALAQVEEGVHGRFAGRDINELREAWRARETSRASTRGTELRPAASETEAPHHYGRTGPSGARSHPRTWTVRKSPGS